MSLLAQQSAFRAEIAAEDDAQTPSSPGMEIYRDAYRGRLLAALEVSFERTRQWVGEVSFAAAACHYILTNPPRGWTLDDYGAEFPQLLASLFADDPEVEELAWLEWHLQRAFAAPDAAQLQLDALAQAGFGDEDWDRLEFDMAAGFAMRAIAIDCLAIWQALADKSTDHQVVRCPAETALLVWRQDLSPRFRVAEAQEARMLDLIAHGAFLGEIANGLSPKQLGQLMSRWFAEGLFSAARAN